MDRERYIPILLSLFVIANVSTAIWQRSIDGIISPTNTTDQLRIDSLAGGNNLNVYVDTNGTLYTSTLTSDNLEIKHKTGSTYTTLQDYLNIIQSSGITTGGTFIDNNDGTVTITAGTGLIRNTNNATDIIYLFNWNTQTITPSNNTQNYIYINYTGGIQTATTMPTDHNSKLLLGVIYKEETDLHIVKAGQTINNYMVKTFFKDVEINGKFQRVNGMMISETGTRNIALTAGSYYAGLTKVNLQSFDSSTGDTFTYYYRDGSGGWNKITGQTQIDNTHYDDGSGTLATLSSGGWFGNDRYGVHWIYEDIDRDIYVIYGQGDYTLAQAQDAKPPNPTPDIIKETSGIVGKIIIQKGDSTFTSIQSSFTTTFTPTAVTNHNDLSNIQGGTTDEYYHINQTVYNDIENGYTGNCTNVEYRNGIAIACND